VVVTKLCGVIQVGLTCVAVQSVRRPPRFQLQRHFQSRRRKHAKRSAPQPRPSRGNRPTQRPEHNRGIARTTIGSPARQFTAPRRQAEHRCSNSCHIAMGKGISCPPVAGHLEDNTGVALASRHWPRCTQRRRTQHPTATDMPAQA
jgi:hypothetical protein